MRTNQSMTAAALVAVSLGITGCGKGTLGGYEAPHRPTHLMQATEVYGPLSVRDTGPEGIYAASARVPWSGDWLPAAHTTLFKWDDGGQAPLQKYDRIASAMGVEARSAALEERKHNSHVPESWEGRCPSLALASQMIEEPRPHSCRGVQLSRGDLKALATLTFDVPGEGQLRFFGQRFNGDTGEDRADIYADQFHRFLQAELFEKGLSFQMDKYSNQLVWNVAVYRASVVIRPAPGDANRVNVETQLFYAKDINELPASEYDWDFKGTWDVGLTYTYDLFGNWREDGTFDVSYGEWTGKSVDTHPDWVTAVSTELKPGRRSFNTEVDTAIVDRILSGEGC
jgi:hypothetical protein